MDLTEQAGGLGFAHRPWFADSSSLFICLIPPLFTPCNGSMAVEFISYKPVLSNMVVTSHMSRGYLSLIKMK